MTLSGCVICRCASTLSRRGSFGYHRSVTKLCIVVFVINEVVFASVVLVMVIRSLFRALSVRQDGVSMVV